MKPTPLLPALIFTTGLLLTAGPAFAQMAEALDSPAVASPASAPVAPAPAAVEAATREILPSRYAGDDELPAYVRELSARFSIRKRVTDPFGRYQDPDHVVPEPKIATKSSTQSFKPTPPMPFSDVVAGIAINTVIPGKQRFLIGNREFGVSDVLTLRLLNGKELKVQVMSVSASRIRFLNLSTQETANLVLNMLPAGMQKGTGNFTAPGMDANDSAAPIEIQPVIPLSTNH